MTRRSLDGLSLETDQAALFISASETDSNLYFACRFLSGDPIAFVIFDNRRILVLSELELGRGRSEADVDEVVSLQPYEEKLRQNGDMPRITDTLDLFLRERGIRRLVVPVSFPVGHADRLRRAGYEITSRDDPFFPERAIKTAEEIDCIRQTQALTAEAMDRAIDMIRGSRINGETLEAAGRPLRAEDVRTEIHRFLFERDALAVNTIVAGGNQACDPHAIGMGPLPAHRPIIIDIFPRSTRTRYWGDMTRTVLRGRASRELERLYQDVFDAHGEALSRLRDGVDGQEVHRAAAGLLKSRGRRTGERDGRVEGFFHSTGHGVGLDIHEYPKVGRSRCQLRAGNVVTIEPGLYYFDLGGVRIEDTVLVTAGGHESLVEYPYKFVIA